MSTYIWECLISRMLIHQETFKIFSKSFFLCVFFSFPSSLNGLFLFRLYLLFQLTSPPAWICSALDEGWVTWGTASQLCPMVCCWFCHQVRRSPKLPTPRLPKNLLHSKEGDDTTSQVSSPANDMSLLEGQVRWQHLQCWRWCEHFRGRQWKLDWAWKCPAASLGWHRVLAKLLPGSC